MADIRKAGIQALLCLALCFLLPSFPASAGRIAVPEGTEVIGSEAFSGCAAVTRVTVPDSVTVIGEDAFTGCADAVLIEAGPESAAAAYAADRPLDYQADTRYRALIICQTYAGTPKHLSGTAADRDAVKACLSRMSATPYTVDVRNNLSAAEMLAAVRTCFADADGTDVSLLYYNGHGVSDGSLVGADEGFSLLSPAALRGALDEVPGRKVLLVDACYSGKFAEEDNGSGEPEAAESRGLAVSRSASDSGTEDSPKDFVNAFQSAFGLSRRGGAEPDRYFVITAAQGNESGWETAIRVGSAQKTMGLFTYTFCLGCGWNGVTGTGCGLSADADGDGAVSIQEAYTFTLRIGQSYPDLGQTAAVRPVDCRWFAPFRWQD